MKSVRAKLNGRFKGVLTEGASMAGFTTFRIGGPADLLAVPEGRDDLELLIHTIAEEGCDFMVLGRGSNVLVCDGGFRGLVVVLGKRFGKLKRVNKHIVKVESGCELSRLTSWAVEKGLGGLEDLSGIPGTVGGAVRMNAGAMGSSIADVVETVGVLSVKGSAIEGREMGRSEMAFGYRRTALEDKDVIYEVRVRLHEEDVSALASRRREVMRWRKDRQPLRQPTAGSVFKNPPGMTAGELIDRCGLKGAREGGAVVSRKHANFIVNAGEAKAADVRRLMQRIKEEVRSREGVELEEEIKILGDKGEGCE